MVTALRARVTHSDEQLERQVAHLSRAPPLPAQVKGRYSDTRGICRTAARQIPCEEPPLGNGGNKRVASVVIKQGHRLDGQKEQRRRRRTQSLPGLVPR